MKFGYLLLGFLLFANPNLGVVDPVPDLLGCLLLYKGINHFDLLIPDVSKAAVKLRRVFVVSFLKFLSSFFLLFDVKSLGILLSFSFAVVELIYLIPFITDIFNGLSYATLKYNADALVTSKRHQRIVFDPATGRREIKSVEVDLSDRLKKLTVSFLVYRAFVSVLPTLPDLQLFDHSGVVSTNIIRLTDFSRVINLCCFAMCLIGSIIWSAFLIPYFLKLRRDKNLKEGSKEHFESAILSSPDILFGVSFKNILTLAGVVVVSYISMYFDGINILPGFLCCIFISCLLFMLRKHVKSSLFLLIPTAFSASCSIFRSILEYRYSKILGYSPVDSLWKSLASKAYAPIKLLSIIENITLMIVILIFVYSIYYVWCKSSSDFASDTYFKEYRNGIRIRYALSVPFTVVICFVWAFHPIGMVYFQFYLAFAMLISIIWCIYMEFFFADVYSGYFKRLILQDH